MHSTTAAASLFAMTVALLGCEKHPVEVTPPAPPSAVSPSVPAPAATTPTVDPSLPSLDASRAKPKTGTDATSDSTLTRTERDSKMPLPGQANDHSTPEAPKRGDSTAPAKVAK
jgi:hypothetical protein